MYAGLSSMTALDGLIAVGPRKGALQGPSCHQGRQAEAVPHIFSAVCFCALCLRRQVCLQISHH